MSAACEHLHEIAPEVALGIADGEDRAWALEHLDECPECRVRIERLSGLADELLLLAPAAEPPAGFEARVADAIAGADAHRTLALAAPRGAAGRRGAHRRRVRRGRRVVRARRRPRSRRRLPGDARRRPRRVLRRGADGAPGGQRAGYVYGYQGRASWVFAIVYDGVADGDYDLQAVTHDGRRVPLRRLSVVDGHGSAGGVTPVAYDQIAEVRLLDSGAREIADSTVRHHED